MIVCLESKSGMFSIQSLHSYLTPKGHNPSERCYFEPSVPKERGIFGMEDNLLCDPHHRSAQSRRWTMVNGWF